MYDRADDIGLVAKIKHNALTAEIIEGPADGSLVKEFGLTPPARHHADVGLEGFNELLLAGSFYFVHG